jgi:hypothetical protein
MVFLVWSILMVLIFSVPRPLRPEKSEVIECIYLSVKLLNSNFSMTLQLDRKFIVQNLCGFRFYWPSASTLAQKLADQKCSNIQA